jgi:hypothetical protein
MFHLATSCRITLIKVFYTYFPPDVHTLHKMTPVYPSFAPYICLHGVEKIVLDKALHQSVIPRFIEPPNPLPYSSSRSAHSLPRSILPRRNRFFTLLLLLLPLFRRIAFRRPSMNRSDFCLQCIINQSMPRQRRLLFELGRHNYSRKRLAATTCESRNPSAWRGIWWGRGRE